MDTWGWEQLRPWLTSRRDLPVGPLFCVIDGPTRGRPWSSAAVRVELRRLASQAGVRRRFAPHQLRHAPCGRARPGGSTAEHHPAPARPCEPRNNIGLPSGHRHRGDHHGHPHKTRPDDVRHRWFTPLKEHNTSESGRSATSAPPASRTQLPVADMGAGVNHRRPRHH
jgi:hypothetical protein